jgi:hypothetical protein
MSGDHNQYQKPEYVDRRQWKYDPMTGRSLKKPDDISPWENYCYERGYFHALEVARQTSQREWQGLTDEEVTACWKDGFDLCEQKTVADLRDFIAYAVEAKLKEKNT